MVAKPPSWPARRIRALVSIRLVSRSDMVRRIVLCLREDVASKGGKGDMRAHEGSGAARHFLSFRVDQTRVGHIDSTLAADPARSEEHTSELQSLMRISYAVFCLKKKTQQPSITLLLGSMYMYQA